MADRQKRTRKSLRRPALNADKGSTDRRIDRLLAVMLAHPMLVLSGAKIAREIGVSRSSVWRWVQRLRALGVRVKSYPKTGYQLETVPDILAPSLLSERLRSTPFGQRVHHFFRIGSTNAHAMELAAAGEPHGALVVAEEQTAGRGRLGRAWHSPKASGIYVSVILRPRLSPAEAPLLTLAAGLAARDAVQEITGLAIDLRWPNDLLLAEGDHPGKKFCGILTEMQAEARAIRHVVIGVGLNVNHSRFPTGLAATATSLRLATGREYSRLDILVRLLAALDGYYNRLLTEGGRALVDSFQKASSFARGKRVRVTGVREDYTGTTAGLDAAGCLLVKRDDSGKTEPVLAGDVREAG